MPPDPKLHAQERARLQFNLPDLTWEQWNAIATYLTCDNLVMDEDFPIHFELEDRKTADKMCAAGLTVWIGLQNLDSIYGVGYGVVPDTDFGRVKIQPVYDDIPKED